ncbi:MAG TPA: SURF1 family protein [Pseudomonadales bacterium]|nr:SURF1 family protein [Pseudomonadales bacterium]
MTIFVAVFLPLTIALGFWQIDRGAQKRAIEDARLASFGALPLDEGKLDEAPPYARVRIEGRYDGQHQFLVDNHTRHGVPGYVVITPFDSVGGRRVLVNRGWIEAPSSRSQLPEVPVSDATVRIVGSLWIASATTKDSSEWDDHWPKRIEQFDARRIGALVHATVPLEFRLEEDQPGSLEPIVLGEEMTSTRHIGYAVQWFAMASALVIAYVVLGIRRGREA